MPSPTKEAYFTPENLAAQAQELLQAPGIVLRPIRAEFNPQAAALLVLDMQLYFLEPESHAFIPSAAAILPGINRLVRGFYRRCLPVYSHAPHQHPQDAGLMAYWWRDLIAPDERRSPSPQQIDVSQGVFIEKNRYDAFLRHAAWKNTCTSLA